MAAKFFIGQLVYHSMFDYRGVVVDVEPEFSGADEWYEEMALTRPPKNQPWYYVLVHDAVHMTYCAERNLQADPLSEPINHPDLDYYFIGFENGVYVLRKRSN